MMIKKILFKDIIFNNLDHKSFNNIISKKGLFVFPSGPGIASINTNNEYFHSLKKSDLVFFDSGFFVLLLKFLKNIKVKKSLKTLSKFKNYLLLIINNQNKTLKSNDINTLRYYGIGAQIIKELKIRKMILVSRSKKRVIALKGYGIKIIKQEIIK